MSDPAREGAALDVLSFIARKRDGGEHAPEDLARFITALSAGEVPDYQAAAWLMAVYLKGMSEGETHALTQAMVNSGELLDLSAIPTFKVDKHSTGGVGDKTTLVLAPLVAACGVCMPKVSGRALGHTGGTLDKLESIPGMRVDLTPEELVAQARRIGVAIAGQSARMVPADGRLYALRDVTATVASIPLIAASVMCKKLACGADAILLDVKCGSGAFMREEFEAVALAEAMVAIGRRAGKPVVALVTSMDEPLGRAIGNALEVREAIATLRGEGPEDLAALVRALAAEAVMLADLAPDAAAADRLVEERWRSGAGLERLGELIAAQGGDRRVLDNPDLLPSAPVQVPATSGAEGVVEAIDTAALGRLAGALGAGRKRKEDPVDHAVGLEMRVRLGDRVGRGQALATVHARSGEDGRRACAELPAAVTLGPSPVEPPPLLRARLAG